MEQYFYDNFLTDREEYEECEHYWRQTINHIAKQSNREDEWTPWIPRHRPDGSPRERDGNPIYDARSIQQSKAIRIIQHQSSGPNAEIAAWVKTYEPEFADLPREELVLNLSLSKDSIALAELLLSQWIAPDTDAETMRTFISDTLPK